MPKTHVTKTITIDQPSDKVYKILNDFNQWTIWSPWLIMEPEATVTVAEDAKYYEWKGQRVGEGNMRIVAEKENTSIDYDLVFLKPWKSEAKVYFELKAKGDSTEVSWTMDSSLPFFMFWMKKMMEAFVGMDFERGLLLLKDYAEDGKIHSKLDFTGAAQFAERSYIGISTSCTKATLPNKMQGDFKKLWDFLEDKKELVDGDGLTIYHKWDMVKDQIEYTSAVQVSKVPSDLPSGMQAGKIPTTPVHRVKHTGPYQHLGNVWSTMHNMARSKTFKVNKKIHPFEVYGNRPGTVDDKELVTEVHFPTK